MSARFSVTAPGPARAGWLRPIGAIVLAATLVGGGCSSVTPGSSEIADPSVSPSPTAVASPDASPAETPAATPASSPAGPSAPPSPTSPIGVAGVQLPPALAAMTITDGLNFRSESVVRDASLLAVLSNGARLRILEGPDLDGGYWWYRVSTSISGQQREGWVASADLDGTPWIGPAPEACMDFGLPDATVSVTTLADLQAGMLGTWAGCVTTPWVPPYWVTLTFREDGTYSGVAMVGPTGERQPAFYHGSDAESPGKQYAINDLQDSLKGVGQIDIVFDTGSVNRGDLRNIRLMGDALEFEFFHQGVYGPIAFELYRIEVPD